ncbi:MAG: hypothetical protein AB7O47_05665 [Flavobacteriales bacterium]
MIKKELKKIVGLKKEEFDYFIETKQIKVQPARLIPVLKTGDEMALTSIFLSSINLIKEYRDIIFKEIKLSRNGKAFYYTEAEFEGFPKSRIDGLIIIVTKGIITDAVIFEMKSKNNNLEQTQIEAYIELAKNLKITKLVTISNEFVADPTHSPVNVKTPKNISMLHFSWSYFLTIGQIFLFKNDTNIEDEDQVEIMREVLYYFDNPASGISGYTQMKSGWKELSENIYGQKPLKESDTYIRDAVLSWYEEEMDMSLLLSRKLGVLVKSTPRNINSVKTDIKKIVKENYISGIISIKNAVSDIKINAEFERRAVNMSIKIIPPMDKGTVARISWLIKQLDAAKRKSEASFKKLEANIWVEANIKFAKDNIKIKLSDINNLVEITKGKEIQAFHIVVINGMGSNFASVKKFVELIEQLMLDYYEGVVQHMSNWKSPAPKLIESAILSQ